MTIDSISRKLMDDIHKRYGNHKIDVAITVPAGLFTYLEGEVEDTRCNFPTPFRGVPTVLQMYHRNGQVTIKQKEDTVTKPNAKDIADIIAKFPKECQQQVTELVKTLGYPTQPEPKAGQVWKNTKTVINPIRLMVADSLDNLTAVGLDGIHHASNPKSFIRDGEYVFVANSLAEYVAAGGKL